MTSLETREREQAIGWAVGLGGRQRPQPETQAFIGGALGTELAYADADADADEERFPDTSPDAVELELEAIKINGEGRDGDGPQPERAESERLVESPPAAIKCTQGDEPAAAAAGGGPGRCPCCRFPRLLVAVLVILLVLALTVCLLGIEGLRGPGGSDPAPANGTDPQQAHIIDMEVRCPAGQRLYRDRCRKVY